MSRTEERQREKADRRRRPVNQLLSGADPYPLPCGLATSELSCDGIGLFQPDYSRSLALALVLKLPAAVRGANARGRKHKIDRL